MPGNIVWVLGSVASGKSTYINNLSSKFGTASFIEVATWIAIHKGKPVGEKADVEFDKLIFEGYFDRFNEIKRIQANTILHESHPYVDCYGWIVGRMKLGKPEGREAIIKNYEKKNLFFDEFPKWKQAFIILDCDVEASLIRQKERDKKKLETLNPKLLQHVRNTIREFYFKYKNVYPMLFIDTENMSEIEAQVKIENFLKDLRILTPAVRQI